MPMKIEFHIPAEVDMQFLSDVVDIADYRAIDYWAETSNYHSEEGKPENTRFTITNRFGDGKGPQVFDYLQAAQGIRAILETPGHLDIATYIVNYILEAVRTNDAGEIDSEAADVIVQAALYGEVLYS